MSLSKREQSLAQAFRDVERFNSIVGSGHGYGTILSKLKVVLEEVYEALDAVSDECPVVYGDIGRKLLPHDTVDKKELLDGVVDIIYTVFALPRELEALGYDVFGALDAVCENNNTKFVKTATESEMSVRSYEAQGISCKSVYNEEHQCYAVRDSAGKLRKPLGYKSVQLDEFLPKES